MLPIMRYIHLYYKRSYRYLVPTISVVSFILFLYMVGPNPVMESYVLTSLLLFVIAAWLSYSYIDMEDETQQVITVLHALSLKKVILGKLLYLSLYLVPLTCLAVLYPVVAGRFDRTPELHELIISFTAHQIAGMLGVAIAAWFTARLFASRLLALFVLITVIVLSIAAEGLAEQLPAGFALFVWLLPPTRLITNLFTNYEQMSVASQLLAIGAPLAYILILVTLYIWLMHRKRFDVPSR